jgi:RNA recognition motif-containing protein
MKLSRDMVPQAGFLFGAEDISQFRENEMKKLYVGNLSFETTEAELRALFEQVGTLTSVALITDRDTGRSRGFGFVEFEDDAKADEAIQRFNEMEFGGRNLRVNVARARNESRRSRY